MKLYKLRNHTKRILKQNKISNIKNIYKTKQVFPFCTCLVQGTDWHNVEYRKYRKSYRMRQCGIEIVQHSLNNEMA